MANERDWTRIPLMVNTEVHLTSNGEVRVDNPELERAEDAVIFYRFDPHTREHTIRLVAPLADRQHALVHRRDD
ncbi:MAG TPA: hypothetical protein VHB50_00210 [Bryobacteraceae bacterium]|nr:hypothetical protein [Bryobacteraceae bacterium]